MQNSVNPIRVLHVVTSMNRAGLETMLMNYYRVIDRDKVQFDFLVHRSEKADYDDEILALGGRIYHFDPITLSSMVTYSTRMHKFLLEHPEYSIVHTHLDALSPLALSGASKANVPVRIAHSHNNGFSIDAKYLLRVFLKRKILRYATDLFACSESAGRFMFGKYAQFDVIKNAINLDLFSYNSVARNDLRKRLGVEESFLIGHVGRLTHQKNHDFLIDVFDEVSKIDDSAALALVGVGELEASLVKKVESLGLKEKVHFLGSRDDVPNLLQAMDVFVLPSHYEGLGIVAVEAQASGLPCVVSDRVSPEALVTPAARSLGLELGKKKWAEAIRELSRTASERVVGSPELSTYDIKVAAQDLQARYIVRWELTQHV